MDLPFPRRARVPVQIDERAAATVEIRELTLADLADESVAHALGALASLLVIGASRPEAFVQSASALAHLSVCLRVCARVVDGPRGVDVASLPLRAMPPLAGEFARLHFFDEASARGMLIRQAMIGSITPTGAPGSTGSPTPPTSSSGSDTASPTSPPSPSAPSGRCSSAHAAASADSAPP